MVNLTNYADVLKWVIAHGYWFVFLIMCIEGPITTAAAGFAAALGYFNPWIIFLLSILGDLVPDSIYYLIGYTGRLAFVNRICSLFNLKKSRIFKIENLLLKHFRKTMLALKLTPFVSTPGFILVGYLHLSFWKFTQISAAITIPKALVFLILGYFFGQLYNINQYLHYAEIFFPLSVILILLLFFGYKSISTKIGNKIEKI